MRFCSSGVDQDAAAAPAFSARRTPPSCACCPAHAIVCLIQNRRVNTDTLAIMLGCPRGLHAPLRAVVAIPGAARTHGIRSAPNPLQNGGHFLTINMTVCVSHELPLPVSMMQCEPSRLSVTQRLAGHSHVRGGRRPFRLCLCCRAISSPKYEPSCSDGDDGGGGVQSGKNGPDRRAPGAGHAKGVDQGVPGARLPGRRPVHEANRRCQGRRRHRPTATAFLGSHQEAIPARPRRTKLAWCTSAGLRAMLPATRLGMQTRTS